MTKPEESPTQLAHRISGHATMYYLLKKGIATKYTPIDKTLMLAKIRRISLRMETNTWEKATENLGSIAVSAQLLLAGRVAEYRYLTKPLDPPQYPDKYEGHLVSSAFFALDVYLEEYAGHNADPAEITKKANEWGKTVYNYVEGQLSRYWKQIEALAAQLEQAQSMKMSDAFEVLEKS